MGALSSIDCAAVAIYLIELTVIVGQGAFRTETLKEKYFSHHKFYDDTKSPFNLPHLQRDSVAAGSLR
jgi:hypothetical protein